MGEEKRIAELAEAIRFHRELYYNHSAPEISDAQFDALWDELERQIPITKFYTKSDQNPFQELSK